MSRTLSKVAVTKIQATIIAVILVIAVVAGVYYVWFYTPAPEGEVKNPNTIYVESYRDVVSLDPATPKMASDALVDWQVYDTLVTLKGNPPGETTLLPCLAESWNCSSDGKTWTFNLRKNAKFSNGDPLNATAIVYHFDRMLTTNCPNSMYIYAGVLSEVGCCQAIGDYTVKITTDVAFPPFLALLTLGFASGIENPNIVEANGGYKTDWINDKIATEVLEGLYSGPYKVTEYVKGPGGHITLETNEYYWGSKPKTPKVIIEWTAEVSTRILKLKKGDTDLLWKFPATLSSELLGAEGVAVEPLGLTWDQDFIIFSGLDPVGMDEKGELVRQALCYSFPYETVLTYAYGGFGELSIGAIPKGCPGAYDYITTKYDFNLTKAAELLDQAGYTPDPTTGIRLELTGQYPSGAEERKMTFLIWQSELTKIGVKLDLREIAWGLLTERMRKGEVDVGSNQWYPDYADPYHFAFSLLHSYCLYGIPGSHFNNTELDSMIDDTMLETDYDKRMELFKPIQELAAEDPVKIYVVQYKYIYIHRTWLRGFVYNPVVHADFSLMYKEAD